MTKKYLVIIPIPWINYSFSAPVGWLFSNHVDKVKGIYGFELTKSMAKNFQYFIIELNWFTQLKELLVLSSFIKKHNSKSKILIGGLYASLMWEKVFQYMPTDYYIRGDNEYPIQCFLNQENPQKIPNFVGRNFCNDIHYIFQSKDFSGLEFNLDWFPSYFKYKNNFKLYPLPMLLSSKGGCSTVHDGCNYCMGSKHTVLKNIYRRNPLIMSNDNLISLLKKIEKKFQRACIFILSTYQYNFNGHFFELDVNIEIDSPIPPDKIKELLHAFKRCQLHVPIYNEGITGKTINNEIYKLIKLEDTNHQIKFFTFYKDVHLLNVPRDHLLYSDRTFPYWTDWKIYTDFDRAFSISEKFYNWTFFQQLLQPNFPSCFKES